MANQYVLHKDSYKLKSFNDHLVAEVKVGDGQPGTYSFLLNARPVGSNKATDLGKAGDLAGAKLTASVMVSDEREETNWTSVELLIREGDKEKHFGPYKQEVQQHGDKVFYTIDLKLIAQ